MPAIARRAAVLVAMYVPESSNTSESSAPESNADATHLPADARIVLTRRPHQLQHHGGQVCLPGGAIEPGESSLEAALREFTEELGLRPDVLHHLGPLSRQYVYASNNQVQPHLILMERPQQTWQPDSREVETVIEIPVAELMNQHSSRPHRRGRVEQRPLRQGTQTQGELRFWVPGFQWDGELIWGATSVILDELAHHLHWMARESDRPAN